MKYGYIRPIVKDQQCTDQLNNISIEKLYKETHGLAKKRKELENLLMILQKGDDLFVQNIETLADSLQQLLDILRLAERDQIIIHFIDEQITNQTIHEASLLQGAKFFARLQSTFLSHSSTFTLQVAKQQGKSIGRPRKSDENLERAFAMYESKNYTLYDIKEATGISKSTLYRYLDSRSTFMSDEEN
ncbi:recombinase family protein [Sporosarcina sp. Marseille-Q4063]|uniref:recombinase family protein n=1 Tax=Sporosarcina sp. Marseille-Q4063 TaxID=2810514 RepID=UPI001BB0B04C|nr:recombinase family protein [Sporosarcina sp. Marseille-Q4063]QUW22921.1 recombinase family protein [Sporosarcina sp. Marseille-Q4063]